MRDARLEAERLISRILEPAFAALNGDELAEFAALVTTTRDAIDM